jgi:hypothetical protein
VCSRAPERRVFKIDVGNMPSHMAMAFVERVKNEMHQRRIPTVNGGGAQLDGQPVITHSASTKITFSHKQQTDVAVDVDNPTRW